MILPLTDAYRSAVERLVADEWSGPVLVTRGVAHDSRQCAGFVSVPGDGEAPAASPINGYVLYHVAGNQCEILVLHSLAPRQGIGSALIRAVMEAARKSGCKRLWLVTTNDNTRAIRFYQRFGFDLEEVRINALDEARRIKPAIPLTGEEGIPLKHEFEFGYTL